MLLLPQIFFGEVVVCAMGVASATGLIQIWDSLLGLFCCQVFELVVGIVYPLKGPQVLVLFNIHYYSVEGQDLSIQVDGRRWLCEGPGRKRR